VEAIGSAGPAAVGALSHLEAALNDQDLRVRGHAALAIGQIGPQAASSVNRLIDVLAERWMAAPAAEALGRIGEAARAAVPALLGTLKNEETEVRLNAAEALWRIDKNTCDTIPVLIGCLASRVRSSEVDDPNIQYEPDTTARAMAAAILGKMGPAAGSAVGALRKAREEGGYGMEEAIDKALASITSGDRLSVPVVPPENSIGGPATRETGEK
jgi:HEAT repeat protein